MTRHAAAAARIAIVALALVLATGFAVPAGAATGPVRPYAGLKRHAKRASPGLRAVQIAKPPHRRPLSLGRRLAAVRLRLLRTRPVRVRQGRDPPPPLRGRPVRTRAPHPASLAASGGSRLLLRARPRWHLRRRREVHPLRRGAARPSAGRGSPRTGATTAPRGCSRPRAACSRCRSGGRRSDAGAAFACSSRDR
jgi:hypothetical protein